MKRILVVLITLVFGVTGVFAQNYFGAPPGISLPAQAFTKDPIFQQLQITESDSSTELSVVTFTSFDLVVFSYFDSSYFYVYNHKGVVIDSVFLNRDETHTFVTGEGLYLVRGNHRFSLLVGDPVTNYVQGYFAVDAYGRPLSTHINTYFPRIYTGEERLIIFAYEDSTIFRVVTADSFERAKGLLNRGEHHEIDPVDLQNQFVFIRSNKPVSVLTYADQGYHVPAANGTFKGKLFYGYSAFLSGWTNSIIVIAYSDSTRIVVRNSITFDTLAVDTLNTGELFKYYVTAPLYWEVQASRPVTVMNAPYAYYNGAYYHMVRHIDSTGTGVGNLFFCPVMAGARLAIFSHENDNVVTVVNEFNKDTLGVYELNRGGVAIAWPPYALLRVTGTKKLSAISWLGDMNGTFGADFAPLYFYTGKELPDIAVYDDRLQFQAVDSVMSPGNTVELKAWVYNVGLEVAENIQVQFFDGPPEIDKPLTSPITIPVLKPGDSVLVQAQGVIPERPEYHWIYVQTELVAGDERSYSNNVARHPLIPNNDLNGTLAVRWSAPPIIRFENGQPDIQQFELEVEITNNSYLDISPISLKLVLPSGWTNVDSLPDLVTFGLLSGETTKYRWKIQVDSLPESNHAYYFSLDLDGYYWESKTVNGIVHVGQVTSVPDGDFSNTITRFELLPAYPNPFNPETVIPIRVPERERVVLEVYNILGQRVATLLNRELPRGEYRFRFRADQLGSGIYFIHMRAGSFRDIRKIILMK
ncbi:MAG: T9SS type A sorting domain-containing protein [Calditrichaeota bacterium]|nr:T9SS type A sorting domain-containing protein [Calditrichota bacterium]